MFWKIKLERQNMFFEVQFICANYACHPTVQSLSQLIEQSIVCQQSKAPAHYILVWIMTHKTSHFVDSKWPSTLATLTCQQTASKGHPDQDRFTWLRLFWAHSTFYCAMIGRNWVMWLCGTNERPSTQKLTAPKTRAWEQHWKVNTKQGFLTAIWLPHWNLI